MKSLSHTDNIYIWRHERKSFIRDICFSFHEKCFFPIKLITFNCHFHRKKYKLVFNTEAHWEWLTSAQKFEKEMFFSTVVVVVKKLQLLNVHSNGIEHLFKGLWCQQSQHHILRFNITYKLVSSLLLFPKWTSQSNFAIFMEYGNIVQSTSYAL